MTTTAAVPLKWDVFMTPGLPIAVADKPAGVRETYFQATASTLIYGETDAVLVDGLLTVEQTKALADWVASKKKSLTTIYITPRPRGSLVRCWRATRAVFQTPKSLRRRVRSP